MNSFYYKQALNFDTSDKKIEIFKNDLMYFILITWTFKNILLGYIRLVFVTCILINVN